MDPQQPDPAMQRGAWRVLTATERGAAHHGMGLPNQDAVKALENGPRSVVVAVADGHGHHRHFRSARGSQLAVTAACQAVPELTSTLAGLTGTAGAATVDTGRVDTGRAGTGRAGTGPPELEAGEIVRQIHQVLVPAITGRWREAVRADLDAEPITPEEEPSRSLGDDPVIAYGTTLLVAAVWGEWLLLAQIGDGDILAITPDGGALLPVPGDPLLDGRHTTSLCSPGAEHSFRAAAVSTGPTPLLGVMLATDGYANAQVSDTWEDAVGADLAGLISAHPPEWLASQLPVWAARCASLEGSGDDTTIALLLAPGPAGAAAGAGAGSAASGGPAEATQPGTWAP
jgi:protein phosphatase 2C-like protein